MMPTVREVLALDVVAAGDPVVVGGAAGLDRAVRWLHLSDSTDLTGLLQGGELVMTTGGALAGSEVTVEAYVRMLTELGVVGLVVELGTHLQAMPESVAALADGLGVPVIALRERIRYVDVTEQVHRMIVADRYEELQLARATHEAFTSLNIAGARPRDIVTKASEILRAPVVLEDLRRHVVAYAAAEASTTALLDGWAERSRRNAGDRAVGGWPAVPVGTGADQWARLVLPSGVVDRQRTRMVLERAAQSLQLQRMIEQDRDALLVQALGGLLDDLLTGRVSDEAEAVVRAGALGLAVSARYAPLVIKIDTVDGFDAIAQGSVDRQVLSAARQAVSAAGLTALGSIRREATVALVVGCPHPAGVEGALTAVAAGVAERLAGRVRARWTVATAAPAASLIAAAEGLAEAEHVAEVAAALPGRRRLYRSADVRLRGLLTLLRSDPRVQAFAASELGGLTDHDERTGEDLAAVLRIYLETGGSKSQTAVRAGLSRPTLYARLSTIERILGVALDTAESRTSLHAALMIIDAG